LDILRAFKALNYLLGTTVVVNALYIYITENKTIPLYIALAIITAGPLEDLLITYTKRSPSLSPGNKEQYAKIIDNVTSIAFLVLLGFAVLETTD